MWWLTNGLSGPMGRHHESYALGSTGNAVLKGWAFLPCAVFAFLRRRQFLSGFGDGVWFSYALSGDVRVRISTVRGDMAVLSAITFDEL